MRKLKLLLVMALILLTSIITGCSDGDDGHDGAAGINGVDGVDGVDGADGGDVTIADLAELGLVYASDVVAINPTLDLSQTVAYDATTGALTIHFFLTDENGDGIDVTKIPYELRLIVAELVPAADVIDNPGAAWNRVISERGTPALAAMPGTLTLLDADAGEYNYVPAATLAASTNVTRVTMRARCRFNDLNGDLIVVANPVNASYDFLQSDAGTALASSGADMTTTAACEACHGARIGDVGHGGGYTQVKSCNLCHNINYLDDPAAEADLAFMIHRIHAAGTFDTITDDYDNPVDFSEVTYPQEIYTCAACHDGAEASLAYSNPTRQNCGSCHASINFADGTGHDGGAISDDRACVYCHSANAIENIYHNPAPSNADTPEFDVEITMTAPLNGTHYVTGEAPVVTVLLTSADGGPAAVYDAAADADHDRDGNLASANLYVYGPRSHSVPVLKLDSTTDGGTTQGSSLFIGADANVTTTAAGFSYQLQAIPADLAPGTYMVRFEGGDFGQEVDPVTHQLVGDYVTSSNTTITFQIGTADEEPKLSGDACIDCHGDTRMHLGGAHPHNTPFDTDDCLACHDFSGNYGDYIGNRVHAVHSESVTGDTHSIDWSEVTYPQEANNCLTCHTNADADTPVWETPTMLGCGGCHGVDAEGAVSDYPDADEDTVRDELAAAAHMVDNGGTTDAEAEPTLSCLVCHGEGRTADPYETHDLIRFRELPVDPNE
jgi:OmcA/MtrC family decaheme c-type cytochrome